MCGSCVDAGYITLKATLAGRLPAGVFRVAGASRPLQNRFDDREASLKRILKRAGASTLNAPNICGYEVAAAEKKYVSLLRFILSIRMKTACFVPRL